MIHQELWVGYARHKTTGKVKLIGKVWTKPLQTSNSYAVYPPLSATADEVVYKPGSWAHTPGTPKVHPNERDWEFVLSRFKS